MTVKILGRVLPGPRVYNWRFVECTIVGPAVLYPRVETTFIDCPIPISGLIEVGQSPYDGWIALDSCAFVRCVFQDVSLATTRDYIDLFHLDARPAAALVRGPGPAGARI
ncbi:hypothetical protein [Pedococcus sp. 5OH_020]|uniref:hypothetical protein n=1 Tax=Pedococcus sp. 5OH_020 TaxID=2989814 RepID=UPI0022E9AB6A|nr:hypothetical protein [Pedococcus sp. 5OH_020]